MRILFVEHQAHNKSLAQRRHLESLRKNLTSRVARLRRVACSGWGAGATTLRTATLALVHATAECCAPVPIRTRRTTTQQFIGQQQHTWGELDG